MTTIFSGLVVLSCVLTALAQSEAKLQTADVLVVKYSWSKERINWERDPFGGPIENFDDMRRRRIDERRVERAKSAGTDATRVERDLRAEQVIKARPPAPPRYTFVYKASVKNSSAKGIKEIDWDYIFRDAVTGEELGRRQFTSVENISPGKNKELLFMLGRPPTQRISVYALDKKERDGLTEEVVIVRVLYADGSVWQLPSPE
jgi:hypothetical protein